MSWQGVLVVGALIVFAAGAALFCIRWWFWRSYIKPAQEENMRLRAKVARDIDQGTRIVQRPWPRR